MTLYCSAPPATTETHSSLDCNNLQATSDLNVAGENCVNWPLQKKRYECVTDLSAAATSTAFELQTRYILDNTTCSINANNVHATRFDPVDVCINNGVESHRSLCMVDSAMTYIDAYGYNCEQGEYSGQQRNINTTFDLDTCSGECSGFGNSPSWWEKAGLSPAAICGQTNVSNYLAGIVPASQIRTTTTTTTTATTSVPKSSALTAVAFMPMVAMAIALSL